MYHPEQELTIKSPALNGSELKAIFCKVENSKGAALLFHNSSGDLNNPIIKITSEELNKRGYSTLRINYHFVGTIGSETATWEDVASDTEAAFLKFKELEPEKNLYLIGKSLGILSSLYLASKYPSEVKGVGAYSVPKSLIEKYLNMEELKKITAKVVAFQGDKDRFGNMEEIEKFFDGYLSNINIKNIPDAEHSFERVFSEEENVKIANLLLDLLII